jgi:hypothetical protein
VNPPYKFLFVRRYKLTSDKFLKKVGFLRNVSSYKYLVGGEGAIDLLRRLLYVDTLSVEDLPAEQASACEVLLRTWQLYLDEDQR